VWSPEDGVWLGRLREGYEAWEASSSGEDEKIPRLLHQIWLGPKDVPFGEFTASLRRLHPTWEYRLWRDADVEAFGLANVEAYRRASNYGEKSDILRYEILHRLGGVYVDVDVEPLRPFDAILRCGVAVGFSNVGAVEVNNAVIAARPGHDILHACVRNVGRRRRENNATTSKAEQEKQKRDASVLGALLTSGFLDATAASRALEDHLAASTIERTGPGFFTRIFCTTPSPDAVCFPPDVFYPVPNAGVAPGTDLRAFTTDRSLAIHHWAKSWQQHHTDDDDDTGRTSQTTD